MAQANLTAEEMRRLEKLRLQDSLMFYQTDKDVPKVEAKVAPIPGTNLANVTERLDALNLEPGQRALTEAFAVALNTGKQRGKTLTLAEVQDPVANGNLDFFQVDMTKETVAGMIGTEYVPNVAHQRRFYSFPFKNDAMKNATLKDLVMYCFMKSLAPVTAREARAAYQDAADDNTAVTYLTGRRNRQQAALIAFMGTMNTAKVLDDAKEDISQSVQNQIMRTTTLTNICGKQMIGAPVLGNMSSAEPETLRNLNTVISNTPFGSPHCNKPLNYFLQTVAGVINGQYSEKGAYQILSNVLSGAPHQLVIQNEAQQIPFANCWVDLQITYNSYGQSNEGVMSQIRTVLRTRPTDVTSSIGLLRQLFWKKNQFRDPSERDLIINSETKDSIFSLLQIWYPTYLPTIRARFEEVTSHARGMKHKILPAPQLLTFLCAEYIKSSQALPQKTAEMNAISIYSGLTDSSEEALVNDTQSFLAKQPEINAFHQGGNNQSGKAPAIPDHLRDKCIKCASPSHFYRNCDKYPGEPVGHTVCMYCGGKHIGKCKNLSVHEIQALPAPADIAEDTNGTPELYMAQYGYNPNPQ